MTETSQGTRTVIVRLDGAPGLNLRWNEQAGASVGDLPIPPEFPPGRYMLTVTAEDIAHNSGSQEVALDVVP